MIRSTVHFGAKIFIGISVPLLLLLSGLFSMLETIFTMVFNILARLPKAVISFLLCITVILTIVYLADDSLISEGWSTYTLVMMWAVIGIFCWLIGFLGPMAAGIIQAVLILISPGAPAAWLFAAAEHLSDTYMTLEHSEKALWTGIITFPFLIFEYAGMLFGFIVRAAAWIGMPLLCGSLGYHTLYTDFMDAQKGTLDWWACIIFFALCGVWGLYLGISASQSAADETED